MKRKVILSSMVVFLAVYIVTATTDRKGQASQQRPQTNGIKSLTEAKVTLAPLKAKLNKLYSPSQCRSPKPADFGCTTLCKPCVTWICRNRKWERLEIRIPERVCNYDAGTGTALICPRNPDGFCPAECDLCY